MIRFKSILSRIVVLHAIAVAITSVLMSIALSWLLTVATDNIHNEAMAQQAETISRHLTADSAGELSFRLPPDVQGLYSQPYGRYAYTIVDEQGSVLFSSRTDSTAIFPIDRRGPNIQYVEKRESSAPISGTSVRRVVGGRTLYIQTAEDLSNRDALTDDIVSNFYRNVGWITLPILLVLVGVDIAIFRGALLPLRDASEIAQSINPTRTDLRLPIALLPSELRPLVRAINQALDRLEHGFRSQREFTADAAHELRTPLSILRARVEMLEDQHAAVSLKSDIDAMSHIVGQLLDIAELDALDVDPQERADLHMACTEVVESVATLALRQDREIALLGASGPVWVYGNFEMMKRALRNLADNAIKHTPPGSAIEFVVDPSGRAIVRDEGPGIPAADREQVFRRFWRQDRSKAGSTGLGLPIVRRIVDLHGATIGLESSPSGGAEFTIQFRPVPDGEAGSLDSLAEGRV